jgi:uncharacterized membrane protein
MNLDKQTFEIFNKYRSAEDKSHDLFSSWVKTIVAVSAGLVSVLVSLRQTKSDTPLQHVLFSLTIIGLTLGILSGVILLRRQIALTDKQRNFYRKKLGEKLLYNNFPETLEFLSVGKLYKIAMYVFYLSLTISLLALTVYAVLKDSLTVD